MKIFRNIKDSFFKRKSLKNESLAGQIAICPYIKDDELSGEKDSKMHVNAFSLAEILIVLAIMGILIMLVVPNQAGVASRTKSLEAQQELKIYKKYSKSHSKR